MVELYEKRVKLRKKNENTISIRLEEQEWTRKSDFEVRPRFTWVLVVGPS